MQYIFGFLVLAVAFGLLIEYWYFAVLAIAIWASPRIVRELRKRRYFTSEEFLGHREQVQNLVKEHNDVAEYAGSVLYRGSFQIGASTSGSQVHLSQTTNTSRHNYRRDRVVADYSATNVHNCSLQVVRNAHVEPLKYVMKYFNIKPNQETLQQVESLGSSIASLEGAMANLRTRESQIAQSIDPPNFIIKHYSREFFAQVGVELPPIKVPYPSYKFQYVSAGGNSGQETTYELDSTRIDMLVSVLAEKIRWTKSAAGQRALMTAKLRHFIKERDGFACRQCDVSVAREPNLLLEVDHIIPVSRGGLSTVDNLQTLCWRCNRTKSNKL